MRLTISFALAVLAGAFLVACNSAERSSAKSSVAPASPAATVSGDNARRITVAELKALLDKNEAVVIDVRTEAAYNQSHIKGAKLIPTTEILKRSGELPRDKTIVTYCSWPSEHTSAGAVVNLKTKGIENAAALLGGFAAWQKAGLPVEGKPEEGKK